jgi:hypothetical protein
MRITLEDLRLYFSDRKGDTVSAFGVAGLAALLMLLARVTGNQVLGLVAFVNFAFLWVPVGSLWQKRRLRERWREQGLDGELLRHCESLVKVDWSLDEHVDTVLSVYTTIYELARHSAWFHHPAELDDHLATVREGLLAFFQRVERVDELRRLYDRCAESLRRPGRLAALQARVDREYRLLERFADAFERALLDFSEAMAAAMSSTDERAMTEQLNEFASSMRRLAQSIDETESAEQLLAAELDPGIAFDRLLSEDDALMLDEDEDELELPPVRLTADQDEDEPLVDGGLAGPDPPL